ncbi:PQQ-binding-like beta-propeller repeat protein [Psychrobacillus psychrodurans]|uniref:PQQ-binding-like beta-propeller repeat protein n=1 Tax=Psychrobacillus psychrodurans TaxID=126157 RepID=A0A9X3RAA2_9BACI|nr:PQQ-binding-like beta-propeller repeat protein [Psychrobacillus psychrodurans]MCZ8534315.1 PQQ-binding-like beta-propeller repeat protein [Psychrobacillus psychrodurans]
MRSRGLSVSALIFIGSLSVFVAFFMIFLVVNFEKSDDGNDEVPYASITVKEEPDKGQVEPSPSNDDAVVNYASTEWTTHGGDYYNRRYSMLNQITTENIGDLKPTWVSSLGSGAENKYSGEATPIVVEGIMYIATGANDIFAIDAKTGEQIWAYTPEIPQEMDTVCCGWTTRGVAVGDGKVYAGLLDARLIALDQKTGELLWETTVAEWEEGYTVTSAPLYYNGKVYTGVAGGEYGIRGRVMAYDSDLGSEVWRFYTIPGPADEHGDTWPSDNDAWLTGGGPVWNTPAVDPELGYIYFATGNTAPDLDGSNREGDNLYANSVVAVNAENGEYVWHFQEVHHDIWDMDPANPVILFDVEKDGEMRKGLGQAGKTGWIYFLDRTDGTPLVGIEEKPVPQDERQKTAATQPFPVGDAFVPQGVTEEDIERDLVNTFEGEIGDIFTPFWDVPVTLKPSPQGGANWPPSAYNPDTELFYVLGNDTYVALSKEDEAAYEEGSMYIGSIMAPVSNAPQRGTITAMDVKTNKIVWQVDWDAIAYSGVLTTAGNLVFVGHNDGRLIAFDAKTGEQVWEYMMDAGANAPSVTYEIDGEQYISIYDAGNALAGTKHGDKVYTFKLGGALPEGQVIDASAKGKATKKVETEVTVSVDTGLTSYKNSCIACHGDQGANGHNGPNLQNSTVAEKKDEVIDRIINGKGAMPSFKDTLTAEEIDAIAEYVATVISPLGD